GAPQPARSLYDFGGDQSFPAALRVASYRAIQWTGDGSSLLFGVAPREPKPPTAAGRGSNAPARVQVWHWKDLRQFHQQEVSATRDRTRPLPVWWNLGAGSVTRLSDDYFEGAQFSEHRTAMLATDQLPYAKEVISGRSYRDLYHVDLATGKRTRVVAHS